MSPLGHRGESSRHSSITKWTPFRRSYSSLNRALVSSVLLLFIGMAYGADVLTAKNDNARTGQNLEEIILNTKNVNVQQFGKLYTFPVDGYVYAQPLYKSHLPIPGFGIRDVLFVATAHDSVYAFDALGNNPASGFLWSVSFLDSSKGITTVPAGDVSTNDIVPEIGITGSPVIDSATNTLYVVSKTKQSSNGTARWIQQLHALDLATGAEKMNGPIEIQASLPGWGAGSSNNILTFDPRIENQRAALVLVNNGVYVAWAAHGDQGSYHGWIIGYSAADMRQQLGAWTTTPNGRGGGIWMSGGGLSSDISGNLYFASGNGNFQPPYENYGDTAFRLSTSGGLNITDYFTPDNQQTLDAQDNDMGTSDMMLLPAQPGPHTNIVITADKSGTVYVLDRDRLGGNSSANPNNDVDHFHVSGTIHNSFSYFNSYVYIGCDGQPVRTYKVGNGTLLHTAGSESAHSFGQNYANASGTSISISANGTSEGIAWALDNVSNGAGPTTLFAFDAFDLGNLLYSSDQAANGRDLSGPAVKFTVPTVVDGRVFVPNAYAVTVYGLLTGTGQQQIAPAPIFSEPSGTSLAASQLLSISSTVDGATVRYTTDGSTPNLLSTVYTMALPIVGPTIVQAFTTAPGYAPGPIATAFYIAQKDSTFVLPSYPNGFSEGLSQMFMNNGAKIVGSVLRLTDGGANEATSAFFGLPVDIRKFTTAFSFRLSSAMADGFTFTIQGDSPLLVGATGGGLGYGPDPDYHVSSSEKSIPHSVAVKFDLYDNEGEGNNSIGLAFNGVSPTTPALDLSQSGIDLHSGHVIYAELSYDGTRLTVFLLDSENPPVKFVSSFPLDVKAVVGSQTAFVGFTAGTGALSSTDEILSWGFSPWLLRRQ
jgi:hypothetical protein